MKNDGARILTILLVVIVGAITISFNINVDSYINFKRTETSISYSKDVLPIFRMRCIGCHSMNDKWWGSDYGPVNNFNISTYKSLMQGGNKGIAIIPFKSSQSPLIKYIESKEIVIGSDYTRMPFVQKPLSSSDINIIRTWIDQGAKYDSVEPQKYTIRISNISLSESIKKKEAVTIVCRVPVECYATIIIRNSATNEIIDKMGGAIQIDSEYGALGSATTTDSWLRWGIALFNSEEIVVAPPFVTVDLLITDNKDEIWGAEFGIERGSKYDRTIESSAIPNPISLKKGAITFKYRVDVDSNVDVEIGNLNNLSGDLVFTDHKVDIPSGLRTYPWNLSSKGKLIPPGDYFVRFRCKARNSNISSSDVCLPFKIIK